MLFTVAAAVALIACFLGLGYATRRMWIGAIPFLVPAYVVVAMLLGDNEDCREFCGADWALVYGLIGALGAAVLAGAVALGVWLRSRASSS